MNRGTLLAIKFAILLVSMFMGDFASGANVRFNRFTPLNIRSDVRISNAGHHNPNVVFVNNFGVPRHSNNVFFVNGIPVVRQHRNNAFFFSNGAFFAPSSRVFFAPSGFSTFNAQLYGQSFGCPSADFTGLGAFSFGSCH